MYTIYNTSSQNLVIFRKADNMTDLVLQPGTSASIEVLTQAMRDAETAGTVVITGTSVAAGITTTTASQGTNITTAVTVNGERGLITTQAASTAALGSTTFTVNNDSVTSTSNVQAWIANYAGVFTTNGIPVVNVDNRAAGAFDIVISNAHGANALSGALVIGFEVKS